jgi:hypothetical protein
MERRKYLRHPFSYPLRVSILQEKERHGNSAHQAENIGGGGLQFRSDRCMPRGSGLEITFKVEGHRFELDGEVVRCEPIDEDSYMVAVAFNSAQEQLKARLAEQAVRIELLKERFERRFNRELEMSCLARTWIQRYASAYAHEHGF